jgi:glycosyltransferase involved in cell wall biosynthesis
MLGRRLHLVENGVDLSEVDASGDVPELLRSWHADGMFVMGYVGRLDAGKRIDTLIHALKSCSITRKRLCIVGDGPERHRLERLAAGLGVAEHVLFLGFREDRLALMRGFDVFVLPSQREGIPRCLMEAMALGTAVVASDISGCRTLVQDNVTGLLFSPGDSRELAEKIAMLAESASIRAALAIAGREFVRRVYSAEAMAGRYLSLYRRLHEQTIRQQYLSGVL